MIFIKLLPLLFLMVFTTYAAEPDTLFRQPVSIKYKLPEELKKAKLHKVVVDDDDIVYVLTDRGLYRAFDDQLAKDQTYRPLAGRSPVDITVQAGARHLYYLYEDQFLTNAYGGKPYGMLPKGEFIRIAVNEAGQVLLSGDKAVALYSHDQLIELKKPQGTCIALYAYKGSFYYLTLQQVYRLEGKDFELLHKGSDMTSLAFRNDEVVIGTTNGYYGISKRDGKETFPLITRVPVPHIKDMIITPDGLWAATTTGAFMREPKGGFRYYASKRWLDQDEIQDIAADQEGNIYALTATGLNKIEFIRHTLADKAAYFQQKIRQRHIRYGFISELRLNTPGDITTAEMIDTDNDGLWTAFYLGSQAFRFAVTGEEKARRNAWEAFEAYERLLSLNQLKGFPSRTFERKGFKFSDPERWRDAPDPEWEWKGHTSSDEFVGYIWIASLLDQFVVQTESEKKRVADFIDAILTHIIENDYYFVDIDGKPTLWGRWNPEYINWYPETIVDRRLGSTHLIAGLQLGYALTGKEIYKTEAYRMINEHGYLDNIMIDLHNIKPTPGYVYMGHDMGTGNWNHSDDEMAFLTYWVLYYYAFDNQLKEKYKKAIRNHWEVELPEKNPVWHLITLATEGSFDKEATLWSLREFPMDLIRYDMRNSHRKDLTFLEPNLRRQHTKELLPWGERKVMRYNANPFELDGGSGGTRELAGDEYLLPYWMGRYLGVIGE